MSDNTPSQQGIGGRRMVGSKTMAAANQHIRRGGNTGYGLSVARGPGGGGLSDAQGNGMSNQDRINANVSSFEAQTAAIRGLRNAQRQAQGLPDVGQRRASGYGGVLSWSQDWDAETQAPNARVTMNNRWDDAMRIRNPKDRRLALQQLGGLENAQLQEAVKMQRAAADYQFRGSKAAADQAERDRQYGLKERGQALAYQMGLADLDYQREAGRRTAEQAMLMKGYDHMLDLSKKEFQAALDANKELSQAQQTQRAQMGKDADAGREMLGQVYPLDALAGDKDGRLRKGGILANLLYDGLLLKAAQENRQVSPTWVASLLLQGMQRVEEEKMSEKAMPAWLNEQLSVEHGRALRGGQLGLGDVAP